MENVITAQEMLKLFPTLGSVAETVVEQMMRLGAAAEGALVEIHAIPQIARRLSHRKIEKLNPADRVTYRRSISRVARRMEQCE